MKKIYILILLFLIGHSLFAESIKIGELYYNLDDETLTAEVTYEIYYQNNYENLEGEIIIPENLDYNNKIYKVTSIGKNAFTNCENMTSIKLPESIQTIGQNAFLQCFNLKSVYLPPSLTKIGDSGFYSCRNLEEVNIADFDAWCRIDFDYFYGNPLIYAHRLIENGIEITEVDFPADLTEVKTSTFSGGNFTKITFHSDIEAIGDYAFSYCPYLNDIVLPPSLKKIGERAFQKSDGLREIVIPDAVETIGEFAFLDCTNLEKVTLPENLTVIQHLTFKGCKSLVEINIPPMVTKIEHEAFNNCESLMEISLPASLIEIEEYAFSQCYNLKSISMGASVSVIGINAFLECFNLKNCDIKDLEKWCLIDFGNYYSNPLSYTRKLIIDGKEVNHLKIPETISKIKPWTFYGCSNIFTISFPVGLESISGYAFAGCSNISTISFPVGLGGLNPIGGGAFAECFNIRTMYCEFKPMRCSESIFPASVYDTATIVIPEGSWGKEYHEISPWNKFQNITYYPYAGLDETINEKDNLYTVYTLDGKLICENAEKESLSHLQPGIYIINGKKVKL